VETSKRHRAAYQQQELIDRKPGNTNKKYISKLKNQVLWIRFCEEIKERDINLFKDLLTPISSIFF